MIITFLGSGTSGGVPMIGCNCEVCRSNDSKDKRLRSSILIEVFDCKILIDCGPDFRQQLLTHQIKDIDAIVLTHEHYDHIGGFDDIRALNFVHQKPMEFYCEQRVQIAIESMFSYVFNQPHIKGLTQVNFNSITESEFMVGDIPIVPIRAMHHKLPVLGFRINDFTYLTDANAIDKNNINKIKGSKILVLNALRKSEHISHFSLSQAIDIAKEVNADQTYFIHISHQLGLHNQVENELPDRMFLAYDGITIEHFVNR